ncbi:MAG: hypothetical protein QE488_06895 [Acidovorax sp.]|nr:hypothetical protein [Acidovorax sp.]
MTITGQSGAAMLLLSPEPRMSQEARRIVRCAAHIRMFMDTPEKSAWFDEHMFEVETALRRYASDYISQACTDLDAVSARSRAAAANLHFSTTLDGGGFCQAGVVAPPDSLMCEKSRFIGQGASR